MYTIIDKFRDTLFHTTSMYDLSAWDKQPETSLRDIASRMGVSKSTVDRMLREVSGVPDGQTGQVGQTGQDGLSQVSQPSHLSNGTAGGNAITCKTNDDGTA